jgi:hypothetical protein
MTAVLRVFLVIYMFYAYAKFVELFARSKASKKRWLRRVYAGSMVRVFDDVMLVVMITVVVATAWSGLHVLSFTSGLLVGMTLIQIFFHRFDQPLTEEWTPAAPVTPLKLMAYAIQAMPQKAWRELLVITVLFAGLLVLFFTGRGVVGSL